MEQHYEDLSSKPFFASLIEYMTSGPVVAMVGGAHLGTPNLTTCPVIWLLPAANMHTLSPLCLRAQLWRGKGVVRVGRTLLGETNPGEQDQLQHHIDTKRNSKN